MKGYSHTYVFNDVEMEFMARAEKCVEAVVDPNEKTIRCHELARAVGDVLGLDHVDGFCGSVDHTWLRLETMAESRRRVSFLDVYCVARLPMVQLIDPGPLFCRDLYRPGVARSDIDRGVVDRLVVVMRKALL